MKAPISRRSFLAGAMSLPVVAQLPISKPAMIPVQFDTPEPYEFSLEPGALNYGPAMLYNHEASVWVSCDDRPITKWE